MAVFNTQNSVLLAEFQNFYYELLRQKEKALRMREHKTQMHTVHVDQDLEKNPDDTIKHETWYLTEIQNNLSIFFEAQQNRLSKNGVGNHFIMDSLYIMVTLTDEIFMTISWPGAREWTNFTLEAKFFQTQIAGELIFKKIDTLLASNDPIQKELALLYMLSLSLGFCGQYRGGIDKEKLLYYRQQLYSFVEHKPSNLAQREKLFPECYEYNIVDTSGKGLPDLRTWGITAAIVLGVYVLVSYVIWYQFSADLNLALGQIFEQTSKGPNL